MYSDKASLLHTCIGVLLVFLQVLNWDTCIYTIQEQVPVKLDPFSDWINLGQYSISTMYVKSGVGWPTCWELWLIRTKMVKLLFLIVSQMIAHIFHKEDEHSVDFIGICTILYYFRPRAFGCIVYKFYTNIIHYNMTDCTTSVLSKTQNFQIHPTPTPKFYAKFIFTSPTLRVHARVFLQFIYSHFLSLFKLQNPYTTKNCFI